MLRILGRKNQVIFLPKFWVVSTFYPSLGRNHYIRVPSGSEMTRPIGGRTDRSGPDRAVCFIRDLGLPGLGPARATGKFLLGSTRLTFQRAHFFWQLY